MDKNFKHSNIPWKYEKERNVIFASYGDKDHICVANMDKPWCEESVKDGEFIVNAVNNHENLIDSLETLMFEVTLYEEDNKITVISDDVRCRINSLLNSFVEKVGL